MGGVFDIDHYLKDTNFGYDPEAAHIVLSSGANITLVPMDVTTQTIMTHQHLNCIKEIDSPLARYIFETFRPWIDYSLVTRNLPGCWIHDALAEAWTIDQSVANVVDYRVGIKLNAGPTRGKSWRYRPPLRLANGIDENAGGLVHMLKSVNSQQLLDMLHQTLAMFKIT